MLQSMRENMKGTIAFIVVGFLAFILAASLVTLNEPGAGQHFDDVASVNGSKISERELQIALSQERQRLQQQFGSSLPAEFLSEERLRAPVLQGLIQRSVLLDKANNSHMRVSHQELDALITQMPEFQREGRFDPTLFTQSIRSIGHTPASFRALVEEDVVSSQLNSVFPVSSFITEAELKQLVALSRQTRDFSWITLPLADLPGQMTVSAEEIQAHYDNNKQHYKTEEKVAVEYIELRVSDLEQDIEISPEAIEEQYQQEVNRFQQATEREAAHIMIEGDDTAAQEKLAEVQAKLAAGEDFSALAKTYSDDFGSRDSGGNLGVTRGDSFPDKFEAALAELSPGEVSEPVTIDNAIHIIKLLKLTEKSAPSFADSQGRIAAELKTLQAEQIFLEKLNALKDLSYNADSLAEVAEQLSLSVGKTGLFTRSGGSEPVLSDGRVVSAAFSEQVLSEGYTSDVLELAPDHLVVVNLLEHQAVRTLTLDEKTADISTELKLSKAKQQLAEQAESLQTALASGTSLSTLAKEKQLAINTEKGVTRQSREQPVELVEHVFSLKRPVDKQPLSSSLYLANNDYVLLSLSEVNDAQYEQLSQEEQRSARLSLSRALASHEYRAWQSALVEKAEIEIKGLVE